MTPKTRVGACRLRVVVVADGWVQPNRQTVPDHRNRGRCGTTYARREMGVGWVATGRPRPA